MLVTVRRPYGGLEGRRVRVGTRLYVIKPGHKASDAPEGITAIAYTRYKDLAMNGLVTTEALEAPKKVKLPEKAQRLGNGSGRKANKEREQAQKAHKKTGGRTGKDAPPSSSPAAPAPEEKTGIFGARKRRGQRASDGSQSTTPSSSAPGQTANTPQTGDGGSTTDPQSQSGENDIKDSL